MASASLHAPFSVLIKANHLVITQTVDGVNRTLCTLDLRQKPSFYLNNGNVVCRDAQGFEFSLETLNRDEAHDLLTQVAMAQLDHGRLKTLRRVVCMVLVLFVFFLGLVWVGRGTALPVPETADLAVISPVLHAPKPITPLPVLSAPSAAAVRPAEPAPSPTASSEVPDDGWALPQAIRATLPNKLHNAAERKLFTVDYSSGHARTLYVFADPSCPNCKRLEPALNALSDAFNVVVFPVPVIGKEKSIAAITPVLCLPPEQRKAAWDALFDSAPDGLNLGKQLEKQASEGADSKAAQPGECDVALKALGINQVAYQAYLIPGTPWVISDDGRYVSQALLRDPLKLQAFLDEQPAQKGQEVSDASQ
ncbi:MULTISPECIES: thioredoxin fold domain-containing protein [Pseudomonas]|jgi:TrbB protein|uniref:thioredoxin fold domain-containing protein n=1 Tax=Pseudomonas TaxID=286 RepID=UPI0014763AA1|nr:MULTISPECIES: thioredoxin fold domain-containing protein [Pseudomonas]MBJ2242804.1 thioredoxin fold domain-containing protein [Pseudomonas sp. MF6768]MBK3456766.1 thioredoxin fold domain-containing protein [Pseudomonas sp. MF6754]NMZ41994.1 thioredoxin fold domain-containing protein [Pseudomonas proteolytica]